MLVSVTSSLVGGYDSILSISESRLNVYNTSLAADVYIRLTLPGTNNMRI